ncbi:hypothetical protein EJ03DRAFT_379256 [Teratosphaeria nubilosa]|uniref:Uncharacterized protein n=1 Tax=Teratosphaeria nubilosa TaxID=161662 RepID=A0A6G1KSN0_9PEZI|nr:hypothetical protein EJ03DRAFT_379256 [Teratosphaeria nubilosa]
MYSKTKYVRLDEANEEDTLPQIFRSPRDRSTNNRGFLLVYVLLLIGTILITWFSAFKMKDAYEIGLRSPYAGLTQDTVSLLDGHSPYTDANVTLRDQLWLDINVDDGMIALDDSDVAKWNLPRSQRFPWDTTKGIYLLQGHHNLHCARSIYISLMEYREGLPQSRKHHHIIHCLDALRRDVICNADDTPRYTTDNPSPETGHGQHRRCRNWDALNDWAKQHCACYRYSHEELGVDYPEMAVRTARRLISISSSTTTSQGARGSFELWRSED